MQRGSPLVIATMVAVSPSPITTWLPIQVCSSGWSLPAVFTITFALKRRGSTSSPNSNESLCKAWVVRREKWAEFECAAEVDREDDLVAQPRFQLRP